MKYGILLAMPSKLEVYEYISRNEGKIGEGKTISCKISEYVKMKHRSGCKRKDGEFEKEN